MYTTKRFLHKLSFEYELLWNLFKNV